MSNMSFWGIQWGTTSKWIRLFKDGLPLFFRFFEKDRENAEIENELNRFSISRDTERQSGDMSTMPDVFYLFLSRAAVR